MFVAVVAKVIKITEVTSGYSSGRSGDKSRVVSSSKIITSILIYFFPF